MSDSKVKDPEVKHRVGDWLPSNHRVVEQRLEKILQKIEKEDPALEHLHPVIQEFHALIESDPELLAGFEQMFKQVPNKPPYNQEANLKSQVILYSVYSKKRLH